MDTCTYTHKLHTNSCTHTCMHTHTHLFFLNEVLVDDPAVSLMPHLFAGSAVGQVTLGTTGPTSDPGGWGGRLHAKQLLVPPCEVSRGSHDGMAWHSNLVCHSDNTLILEIA